MPITARAVPPWVTATSRPPPGTSVERLTRVPHRPGPDLGVGLATAPPDVLAAHPGVVLLREPLGGLVASQPLPLAEVDLAQPVVADGGQLGRLLEVVGAGDGPTGRRRHQPPWAERGQDVGGVVQRRAAGLVQR